MHGPLKPAELHLRRRKNCPTAWDHLCTTNLLERLFGEERRRTKVIPHAFGERAVMKLMFASLLRASQTWRGVIVTEFERKQLDTLSEELNMQFDERHATPIQPASRSRIYSKTRT